MEIKVKLITINEAKLTYTFKDTAHHLSPVAYYAIYLLELVGKQLGEQMSLLTPASIVCARAHKSKWEKQIKLFLDAVSVYFPPCAPRLHASVCN